MRGARPLTEREVATMLRHCPTKERCLVLIGMHLGLRVSELASLRWRDTMAGSKVLPMVYLTTAVTKGRRSRAIPVNRSAAGAIRALHRAAKQQGLTTRPQDHLFPGRAGSGHMSPRHVNRRLYQLFAEAGLGGRLSSHTLRKTFGTMLSERGVSLPVIQELLGHANIATTRKYIGVGMGSMRQAVGLLVR